MAAPSSPSPRPSDAGVLPLPSGPVPRPASPVLHFFLDVLIGLLVLLFTSLAAGAVWGLYRGWTLAHEAQLRGTQPQAEAIVRGLGQPGVLAQMLMALLSTSAAALLLYAWRRRASPVERRASRAALRRRATWGWTLGIALSVFAFSSFIGFVAERFGIKPVPTNLALMDQALRDWPLFLTVFAVILAPAYEELLFRRVLFGRLLAAGRPWLGLVLSSLAFALLHEIPGLSGNGPLAICQLWLVYGGMGAAFAWLYWRTGTLWAAIIAHGLNNAVALGALYWFGIQ